MSVASRKTGLAAGLMSIATLLFLMVWPEPTWSELTFASWALGVMCLLSIASSLVAGRLHSTRWYYIAMFWGILLLGFVFFLWYTR